MGEKKHFLKQSGALNGLLQGNNVVNMLITMKQVMFESNIKYELWFKVILTLSVLLILTTGILFYLDARGNDVIPGQLAEESARGWPILLAATVFMVMVFWVILPESIAVTREGLVIKFRAFDWRIPFGTVSSIKPVFGIFVFWAHSWITSYRNQIEIHRKNLLKIRICPENRDRILECAARALGEWRTYRPEGLLS